MLYLQSPQETEWELFLSNSSTCETAHDPLHRSWARSLQEGASYSTPVHSKNPAFLEGHQLKERQEKNQKLWPHIKPVLEKLSHQLSRCGFLGIWADHQGVILQRYGGGVFLTEAQRVELFEGANWSESSRGTNAIGTALKENCEVAVLGRAHLQKPNHNLVCYATPVHDPRGALLGVLDVTSHVECSQDMAPVALLAARKAIESSLKLSAYQESLQGGLTALCQTLAVFPAPAILIERDGTLRARNEAHKRTFGTVLKPEQQQWDWDTLQRYGSNGVIITLPDLNYTPTRFRLIAEPVGTHSDPVAMLLFLEKIQAPNMVKENIQEQPKLNTPVIEEPPSFKEMFGTDPSFKKTQRLVKRFAPTKLPILILAKTGTGKERLARAAHELSSRASEPFIPINCGALSDELLESELFGYADGAFTGAKKGGADGKLAAASGGTLFLDEVAEMSSGAQAMLLRVLEDGTYYRVGSVHMRHADVRIIAATCRDMEQMVKQGLFRSDLYYRLKGATLTLPELSTRSDKEALAAYLLEQIITSAGERHVPELSESFKQALHLYNWPGNIRELKNTLHVSWILSDGAAVLTAEHLPEDIQQLISQSAPSSSVMGTKDLAEHAALKEALSQTKGNLSKAARILGVARSTLYRMMERHGMR